MRFFTRLGVSVSLGLLSSLHASARCEIDISDYVGWTIVYEGQVTGYIDENGKELDDYEGCEYGRQLIVDYTKVVTCTDYNYDYAYNPDIVILTRGSRAVACIDDEEVDISLN